MPLSRLLAALAAAALLSAPIMPAQAGEVLDRIVERKLIRLGYRTDAPPFSSSVDGRPGGFTTDLCGLMAGAIMATSHLSEMTGTFKTVDTATRFEALASGEIDVLCGATTATLKRRETMSFTIPIFATGVGAVVSKDAPELLREVLITGGPATLSGAAVREALSGKRLGVRSNTTAEAWLREGSLAKIEGVSITSFDDHSEGLAAVAEGNVDAYFADKAILSGVLAAADDGDRFALSRNTFTFEPYALAIPRGDEDLRLVLDRALSHIYRSGAIFEIFERHFGKPGPNEVLFYGLSALPE
ncbi:amino acid ABC transporter substrate-binding protein [Limibaculum sp. M0105]|uniref:Amino acid ABC transporter substrate-binding protein n=1 Tax=Thermohalobaculum xanthum TaxID=2753746 RepID=A0A8J7M9L1_9RHOB|nr:amino acid ABC transporter substrate-binding protein [Thermohalobaculum xanthum]MBK0399954.1 amino acid ABC transporter substrate-binding protein [Thermohalobaculum xanthum]